MCVAHRALQRLTPFAGDLLSLSRLRVGHLDGHCGSRDSLPARVCHPGGVYRTQRSDQVPGHAQGLRAPSPLKPPPMVLANEEKIPAFLASLACVFNMPIVCPGADGVSVLPNQGFGRPLQDKHLAH